MSLPLAKVLCLGGGLAGIAAVGGTVIYLNKKDNTKQKETNPQQNSPETKVTKSIKELLKDNGKEILDKTKGDATRWNANWLKFRDAYDKLENKSDWEFEALKVTTYKTVAVAPQAFKEKCESNGNKLSDNNKLYENILAYCVKED